MRPFLISAIKKVNVIEYLKLYFTVLCLIENYKLQLSHKYEPMLCAMIHFGTVYEHGLIS